MYVDVDSPRPSWSMNVSFFSGHSSTMYVSWELGYDTLVFFLTVVRSVYMYWRHQGVTTTSGGKPGLIGTLIRDGAFYFG